MQRRLLRRMQVDASPTVAAALLYPCYHEHVFIALDWVKTYLTSREGANSDAHNVDEAAGAVQSLPSFLLASLGEPQPAVIDWHAEARRIVTLLFQSLSTAGRASSLPPSVEEWDAPGATKLRKILDEKDESMRSFVSSFAMANPRDAETVRVLYQKVLSPLTACRWRRRRVRVLGREST